MPSPARPPLPPLPVDEALPALIDALRSGGAAVLVAPPAAGKTTRVPPALLASGLAGPRRIVVLEPRRVAARAAARRIAEEGGWRLGEEVGYQVRFERRFGPATRILVVTEGLLVQMLQADPFLEEVGAVVFDEIHERSLQSDLALAMARRVRREVRPDLALVAMSATVDPGPIAAFLGGCPVIRSEGRLYPVEVIHLDEPGGRGARGSGGLSPASGSRASGERALAGRIAGAVGRALAATGGDVLVFLPGVGEIARAAEALAPSPERAGLTVVPLHGELPSERQDEALRPLGPGRRRVVLATNVAETSVTVEGVSAVVDSGLVRRLRFDPATGLDRLELGRVSRASAEQRAGRAGRQGPGLCLRLWPAWEHATLPERESPEIARVDLAAPALQLLAWGEADLAAFEWFEPPDPAALASALELLARLGAVEIGTGERAGPPVDIGSQSAGAASETAGHPGGFSPKDTRRSTGTTSLGRRMARLPVHPRLARLLVEGAERGVLAEAALLAATLAERDPFRRLRGGDAPALHASRSDLLDRLDALERFEASGRADPAAGSLDGFLNPGAARFVLKARDQLAGLARRELEARGGAALHSGPANRAPAAGPRDPRRATAATAFSTSDQGGAGTPHPREEALLRCLLAAYPDRLARRRAPGSPRAVMVGGRGVRLAAESAVVEPELFLCIEVSDPPGAGRGEALVRLASAVEPAWLPTERLRTAVEVSFDEERERVVAWKRTFWEDLPISEGEVPPPSEEAERVLAEAAAMRLDRALALDEPETAAFLARLRSLAGWMPELGLPRFGEEELRALLPTLAAGRRSFAELRRAPLAEILEGALSPAQRAALAREAPERLEVPSGSRIRLVYEEGRPPVLAARIQEMFGLAETPRVAAGRVPVLLHLLAPSGRPQQVTQDLASFWARTYPEVKKELQGRYPKHAWPADPWSARPQRRPGRPR